MARRGRRKRRSRQRPSRSPGRPARQGQRRRVLLIGLGAGAVVLAIALVWHSESTRVTEPAEIDPETAEQVAIGERLYAEHCASCHGAELEGQSNWKTRLPDGRYPAPPHDATGHTWHHDDAYLFETTKHGGQAGSGQGFVSGMPAFGDKLTDDEIWAILAFIESRWPEAIRSRHARPGR